MYTEATLAAIASAVSVGVIVRMVMKQLERIARRDSSGRNSEKDSIISSNNYIVVTNKRTKASVQLPPHYDRQAVSKFLEITS